MWVCRHLMSTHFPFRTPFLPVSTCIHLHKHIQDTVFICGLQIPLVKHCQVTSTLMTLWPWPWPCDPIDISGLKMFHKHNIGCSRSSVTNDQFIQFITNLLPLGLYYVPHGPFVYYVTLKKSKRWWYGLVHINVQGSVKC